MTRDPVSEDRDCGADAAACALGALDPEQAEHFRRHLESCAVCRDELTAFRLVVDALPMAAHQHRVPPSLRRQIMRDVRAEPGRAAGRAKRLRPRRLPARLVSRPALAAGLAAAVALVILGGLELAPGGSSRTRAIQASVTGVSGAARLQVTGGHAELVVSHLPPPASGHIYEVWVKRGHHAPSPTSALFSVTRSGAADVGVPGSVRGVSTIMVTQEPAGGSLAPSHAPVIVAQLT